MKNLIFHYLILSVIFSGCANDERFFRGVNDAKTIEEKQQTSNPSIGHGNVLTEDENDCKENFCTDTHVAHEAMAVIDEIVSSFSEKVGSIQPVEQKNLWTLLFYMNTVEYLLKEGSLEHAIYFTTKYHTVFNENNVNNFIYSYFKFVILMNLGRFQKSIEAINEIDTFGSKIVHENQKNILSILVLSCNALVHASEGDVSKTDESLSKLRETLNTNTQDLLTKEERMILEKEIEKYKLVLAAPTGLYSLSTTEFDFSLIENEEDRRYDINLVLLYAYNVNEKRSESDSIGDVDTHPYSIVFDSNMMSLLFSKCLHASPAFSALFESPNE